MKIKMRKKIALKFSKTKCSKGQKKLNCHPKTPRANKKSTTWCHLELIKKELHGVTYNRSQNIKKEIILEKSF